MFNVKDLAAALGGIAVLATHKIEVRLQTKWDVQHNREGNELPLVFSGSMDEINSWANVNEFKRKQNHMNLFGGYFVDDHGNSYILT